MVSFLEVSLATLFFAPRIGQDNDIFKFIDIVSKIELKSVNIDQLGALKWAVQKDATFAAKWMQVYFTPITRIWAGSGYAKNAGSKVLRITVWSRVQEAPEEAAAGSLAYSSSHPQQSVRAGSSWYCQIQTDSRQTSYSRFRGQRRYFRDSA